MGWDEAANLCERAIGKTIQQGTVTYDLERMMTKAELVSASGFGEKIIENMRIR